MLYAIITTQKAGEVGINHSLHRKSSDGTLIIINENDLKNNRSIQGSTPQERAAYLEGTLYTLHQLNNEIQEGGWL